MVSGVPVVPGVHSVVLVSVMVLIGIVTSVPSGAVVLNVMPVPPGGGLPVVGGPGTVGGVVASGGPAVGFVPSATGATTGVKGGKNSEEVKI